MEAEKLCAWLLSCRMRGTFSPYAGLHQVWIDNGSVKALLHDTRALSKTGKRRSSGTCARG
jgi:hypothetical protein